ncbi:50S ribosome-binding GTPase [Solirubrobacter sp. CPCC 204708]|uniref:50S ribosome-binding GTPase n=1 Tax=Solirubrobacter deserti TaxID=2282478 RepID=A0ABT4RT46_9ACTN|nr:GTPase [Solirubrobacter deserti]MBE2319882.1 50S ribosome-binding GTPase [Solirubrobacter deserti]MDA0141415.1 50S ribosome-binding GTPase [Solirubrobacter deserti]
MSKLDQRLSALAEAVELAEGRLDPEVVAPARALVRRAGERLGHGLDATVVALAGPTGAGKSTLFNLLVGRELSRSGVRRPTTSTTTAAVGEAVEPALLDWLEIRQRHALGPEAPEGLALLDLPDFDSIEAAHRAEVDRLVRMVDLLVWVVDPQKYADATLHEGYLRPMAGHAAAMLVVLNQADLLGDQVDRARKDLQRVLASSGLGDMPVLALSARTGQGTDALREAVEERVRSRKAALARLEADVSSVAEPLRAAAGKGRAAGVSRRDRERLVAALSDAAGLPGVVRAVERAHKHRGALAAGVPWISWVRRLRPDPLRRLGLERAQAEDARTSLPPPTPVERSLLDSAIRTLAHDASSGLPEPWPALARRAATAEEGALADRLDRAMAGADLRMTRPRWWRVARGLQLACALAAAAGALWLVALAGLGYLQLDDVVPTPDIGGVPAPTALLIGGLLAGLLLALIARLVNRAGARRRARRARRALHERITGVAEELVIAPLEVELAVPAALGRALKGERKRGRGLEAHEHLARVGAAQ